MKQASGTAFFYSIFREGEREGDPLLICPLVLRNGRDRFFLWSCVSRGWDAFLDIAGDQSSPALEGEVGPCPFENHHEPVAETY